MISSSPKSVARFTGVTVAGIPILTDVSHPASNIADTISVLPGERDVKSHLEVLPTARLLLRAGGRGFSPATKRVTPGYFYWKMEEKENQKKSLAV